jgi:Holliday junction resolvase RusA-like endonuclease
MKLNFKILGTPTPKQSARFRIIKGKKGDFVSSYQSKSVKDVAKIIALQIKPQLPKGFKLLDTPLAADIIFVFPPLKSFSKKKMEELESGKTIFKDTKPDNDNLQKALFDPMEGLVFTNDSRVCLTRCKKIYGLVPRTEITLHEL